jgi:sugar lactone lactonase YvrE
LTSFTEEKTQTQEKIELPINFQYPNGITRANDGTLYIGSVVSGQILQIAPDRHITTFFPGSEEVFAVTSLRVDEQRGILWGTSPDFLGVPNAEGEMIRRRHRVFAIAIGTGKLLRSEAIPDNGFGNDLVLDLNGGVYITDSLQPRIYYLDSVNQLVTWVEDELFRSDPDSPGLAGIARNFDGTTVVGMFSEGEIIKIANSAVEVISLERPLENPDGMQFASDGSLLLTEAAIKSGNGRLVRIDVFSETNPKPVETLVSSLDTPVNLTVSDNEVWITESRIRHRLLPGKETEIPDRFFVHHFLITNK